MTLADQLSDLAAKAKQVQDRVAAAKQKTKADLEGDVEATCVRVVGRRQMRQRRRIARAAGPATGCVPAAAGRQLGDERHAHCGRLTATFYPDTDHNLASRRAQRPARVVERMRS